MMKLRAAIAAFALVLMACTPTPAAVVKASPTASVAPSDGATASPTQSDVSAATEAPTEAPTAAPTETPATAAPAIRTTAPVAVVPRAAERTPVPAPVVTAAPRVVTPVPTVAVPFIPRPAVPSTGLIIHGRVTNAATGAGIGNACVTIGPPIRCFKYTSTGPTAADVGYYVINLSELAWKAGSSVDMYFLYQAGGCQQAYSGIFVITGPVVKNAALRC